MKRILLIDDFEPGRVVLRERLELQGYACQEVENGSEGLKAIETEHFDLIITDNQMPVMTGMKKRWSRFLGQVCGKVKLQLI